MARVRETSTVAVNAPPDAPSLVDLANGVLLVTFFYVLLHPSILNPLQIEPHVAWTIHCYAFGIPVLVINAWARRRLWTPTVFDFFLCAYVAIVLLTWPTSFDRQLTAGAIAGLGAQVVLFAGLRVLAEREPAWVGAALAALVAGIAILEWIAADTHLRIGLGVRLVEIPPLDWDGREGLGLAAAIQCGLLIGIWQRTQSSIVRFAAAVLVLGAIVELLFLYSRLAWVATGAMMILALLRSLRLGGFRRSLVATIAVGALVAIVGTPYMARLARMAAGVEAGSESETGLSFRMAAWLDAPAVIRRHPLVGTGLGTFMAVRPTLDLPRSRFLPPGLPIPVHPHNAYLQQMGEVGIIGGAVYAAMWASALWAGWRVSAQEGYGIGINTSLFLGLVAVAVANLGENMFEGTERLRLQSIAWMMAAFVMAEWSRRRIAGGDVRAEHAV
jgi:O-antigen ligase